MTDNANENHTNTQSTASKKRVASAMESQGPSKRTKPDNPPPNRSSGASISNAGNQQEDPEVLELDPEDDPMWESFEGDSDSKLANKHKRLSYYSKWSTKVEEMAKSPAVWDAFDEVCLNKTNAEEWTLWGIADREFGRPPHDLLPDGGEVEVSRIGKTTYNGTERDNPNWGDAFCESFSKLLCCPAFKEQPEFLKYCIDLAMWYRLGAEDGREKPKKSDYMGRNEDFISSFLRLLPESLKVEGAQEARTQALHCTLDRKFGFSELEEPNFAGFLKYLEESVESFGNVTKDSPYICRRDLDANCKAWNKFAVAKRSYKTIEESSKSPRQGRRGGKAEPEPAKVFLPLKKKWIISGRLIQRMFDAELKNDRRSRSTAKPSAETAGDTASKRSPPANPVRLVLDRDHPPVPWEDSWPFTTVLEAPIVRSSNDPYLTRRPVGPILEFSDDDGTLTREMRGNLVPIQPPEREPTP